MKRRSLTVLLCLLAIISLASVGFASWVISAGDTDEATGNIQVEEVTDQRLVIGTVTKSKESFVFGQKTTDTTNSWLNATNVAEEVLSVTLTFDVTFKDGTEVVIGESGKNATITASWDTEVTNWLTEAETKGYIEGTPKLNVTQNSDGKFEVEVTFKWGSLFGGKNPFEFYNAHNVNETFNVDGNGIMVSEGGTPITYGDHAAKYLDELFIFFAVDKEKPTYKQFRIVITATPSIQ